MHAMQEAITNLELTSRALENLANKPEIYNSPLAQFLETASWEMHRQANDLRSAVYMYGE